MPEGETGGWGGDHCSRWQREQLVAPVHSELDELRQREQHRHLQLEQRQQHEPAVRVILPGAWGYDD